MRSLSVVIPAYNEAENVRLVIESVPVTGLAELGWQTEIIVVDNNSDDGTGDLARAAGATVIFEPRKGYGNAYRAGFDAAGGEVIASGDADRTYPFDHLPELLARLDASGADFMTTDRLHAANRSAMKVTHFLANHLLSFVSRLMFRHSLRDSQSGMWIFRRYVWDGIDVRSEGMAFSQEIKNASVRAGYHVIEAHIEYRVRGGEVKLDSMRDGMRNLLHLVGHRFRRDAVPTVPGSAQQVRVPVPRVADAGAGEGATAVCGPDITGAA